MREKQSAKRRVQMKSSRPLSMRQPHLQTKADQQSMPQVNQTTDMTQSIMSSQNMTDIHSTAFNIRDLSRKQPEALALYRETNILGLCKTWIAIDKTIPALHFSEHTNVGTDQARLREFGGPAMFINALYNHELITKHASKVCQFIKI